MMSSILGLTLLIGPVATGGNHPHPGARRISAPSVCQSCGVDGSLTLPLIARLQNDPRWQGRDNAARELRRFSWRAHPEVVYALCDALLLDPKDDVREEAAEALKEMAPCVPVAHQALRQAASQDPEEDVREEAQEALKKLRKHRCMATCDACNASPGQFPLGSDPLPPAWVPIFAPSEGVIVDPLPGPGSVSPLEGPAGLPEALPPREQGPALEPILEGPIGSRNSKFPPR